MSSSDTRSAAAPGPAGTEPGPDSAPPADGARPRGPRRRRLDLRTVAICALIALVGALAAALVARVVLADDDPDQPGGADPAMELERTGPVAEADLLAIPLETVEGEATSLAAQLDGRPMLVNLWAQWCTPCVEEMPWLESVAQATPEVAVLGVNVDVQLGKATEMAALTGITYPWVRDRSGGLMAAAGTTRMPDTFLLDADGRLLATNQGAFESQADIEAWLDEHVD